MGSQPLLAAFGLRAPLQAVRGYHIELARAACPTWRRPSCTPARTVLVLPMAGRLRASGYTRVCRLPMRRPDPRKAARLRAKSARARPRLRGRRSELGGRATGFTGLFAGYRPRATGPVGSSTPIGHQHIGLTLAPVTAELVADAVAGRAARHSIAAFDLRRFGAPVS